MKTALQLTQCPYILLLRLECTCLPPPHPPCSLNHPSPRPSSPPPSHIPTLAHFIAAPSASWPRTSETGLPLSLPRQKQLDHISYFDPSAQRILPNPALPDNMGYDTDKGFYKCYRHDHIAYRYELLSTLGHGSFGDVVYAFDHDEYQNVAIKILSNKRSGRGKSNKHEAMILELLQFMHQQQCVDAAAAGIKRPGPSNVITMLEHFMFRNHLCIVFEKLDHGDLYSVIEAKPANLPKAQVRQLTTSMLHCVHEIHSKGVIHCDIKPENFLLTSADATAVKIIDFGLSCLQTDLVRSHSFGSLFYSAPEVQLDAGYGMPIDMWSVGCIVAELCTGKPLFTGQSSEQQLALQTAMLGMPPAELLAPGNRSELYFERTPAHGWRQVNKEYGEPGSRPLSVVLRGKVEADALDFIEKCVQWEPAKRMTAAQALQHPFVTGEASAVQKSPCWPTLLPSFPIGESSVDDLIEVVLESPTSRVSSV